MQQHQLTGYFLKQARREYFICENERRCGNLYISIFSEENNDTRFLERIIAAKLDHEGLVSDLFRKVEENIYNAEKVTVQAEDMIRILSGRLFRHLEVPGFSGRLLQPAKNILELVTRFREKFLDEMLARLYNYLFSEITEDEDLTLVSGEIDAMQTLLNHYIDNMREYHEVMVSYLQDDLGDDTSERAIITMKHYVAELAELIDHSVSSATVVWGRLAEWRSALCRIEHSELNN